MNRGPKLVKLRCECCRRDNKKCEDTRPCRYCIEQNVECVNATRKGRGHGTRVMAVGRSLIAANRADGVIGVHELQEGQDTL